MSSLPPGTTGTLPVSNFLPLDLNELVTRCLQAKRAHRVFKTLKLQNSPETAAQKLKRQTGLQTVAQVVKKTKLPEQLRLNLDSCPVLT